MRWADQVAEPTLLVTRDLIARFARSCSSHLTHVLLFATIGQHPREARNPGTTPMHDVGQESVHREQDPENRRGYNMSAVPAPQRIELSPAVRAILGADTPKSQLLRHFLRFSDAILAPDPAGIDRVVTPDARFHELEAIGHPRGPEAFKIFRRQVNAAIPDEHILVTAVSFEGDDIIEADLDISATHTGEEFMGIPATGRKIHFNVHARGRFVDGKMAERWDRADIEDIKRQLSGPTQ
jgi:predicted ester cyclase